jgi:S-adenosylmethionine decarboxylase proenzyme
MYEFKGRHFLASYIDCDSTVLLDIIGLKQALNEGLEKTGVTVLNSVEHAFQGGGFTMLFLLSESHCSIHTYPEHRSVFVDLFTCGSTLTYESFDQVLTDYLKPKNSDPGFSSKMLIERTHENKLFII